VSSSTGTVTVWNDSTLQTITSRGATSNNAVSITNETVASSTNMKDWISEKAFFGNTNFIVTGSTNEFPKKQIWASFPYSSSQASELKYWRVGKNVD
jgi:hypothetical protein